MVSSLLPEEEYSLATEPPLLADEMQVAASREVRPLACELRVRVCSLFAGPLLPRDATLRLSELDSESPLDILLSDDICDIAFDVPLTSDDALTKSAAVTGGWFMMYDSDKLFCLDVIDMGLPVCIGACFFFQIEDPFFFLFDYFEFDILYIYKEKIYICIGMIF